MMKKALLIIFLVLLIDQAIKIYIKTHFYLGQEVQLAGNWAILAFTENNGMAFGMEFAGKYGKIFLSTFRIFAVIGLFWYLNDVIKNGAKQGFVWCMALIIAGAIGNILDSAFYGLIFSDSYCGVAHFSSPGYAGFLHGKVVDMFYFPILTGHFPQWFPFWGSEQFIFFRPIFNFSDASISVGVFLILVFQRKFFSKANAA